MTNRFDIHVFPACEGDCFWLQYGKDDRLYNVLIDGGRESTAEFLRRFIGRLPPDRRRLELLVVTHIDRDHIEGVCTLFDDPAMDMTVGDVWYNGYNHLREEPMGVIDAEKLSALIMDRGWAWNEAFGGGAVQLGEDNLPVWKDLPGGMRVAILSPDAQKMRDLLPHWQAECAKAHIVPGGPPPEPPPTGGLEVMGLIDVEDLAAKEFTADPSPTNGSSIALLFEFGGKSALFSGDAHADLLVQGLTSLAGTGGRSRPVRLDLFKLSHHGSKKNTSKTLLEKMCCPKYLISTDGSGRANHPNPEAIARILKYGGENKTLIFNANSEESEIWNNADWQERYSYSTVYPEGEGLLPQTVSLLDEGQ